ncbi:IucA/IucC family protein [Micromonospora sp. L32]|uniref:IucA/IucC family protein n=1 Tax=unclassified Micromonospora TaxID=2617518 RepID=UPI003F898E2B
MSDRYERQVIARVLDALLREDHLGLSSRGRMAGEGCWEVPDLPAPGASLLLAVRPDGFLADLRVAAASLRVRRPDGDVTLDRLSAVLAALSPPDDEEAEAGWAAFTDECQRDLAARRLAAVVVASLRQAVGDQLPQGPHGSLLVEALAAHTDHPVHPTSRCRHGLSHEELRAYAPEFAPRFALRWAAVPSATVIGTLPDWWPTPAMVGLADDAGPLLPVHPLTAARLDLPLAPEPYLDVTPTLSMRTVAVLADPTAHLKLPLPTATLGARNRRTIAPGTLADGAAAQRLLEEIAAREPSFSGRIRHADESSYGHAGDENLAWLLRRYPSHPADATVLPVAALTADGPAGPLAALLPAGVLDAYLDLLIDWHVALWLGYGVALEAHQQNISLVIAADGGVSLLYKDNDAARIDLPRLASALGQPLTADAFADRRIAVSDPIELADMFTTITLHLCAAAPLYALRERGMDVADPATALRSRLLTALDRWTDPADPGSVAAARLLVEHVLQAPRLPIKAMVTAGTLLPKQRLGCADINKYYRRTGPNYLAGARR